MKKIPQDKFFKSLEKLGTMAGLSTEEMKKSQICTGPNSEVTSWPGGEVEKYSEKWEDGNTNGTDYSNSKAMKKAREDIAEKVMKGEALTPQEVSLVKSDYEKAMPAAAKLPGVGAPTMKGKDADEDDEGGDKDLPFFAMQGKKGKKDEKEDKKDDKDDMGKSMQAAFESSDTLNEGIDVSPFLAEFAKSFAYGLQGIEARLGRYINETIKKSIDEFAETQGEFNKSLAEAVVNIGHGINGAIEQTEAMVQAPARGPKSMMVDNSISKGGNNVDQLSKSQILDHMCDLVEKGQINSMEVIKFESTNTMSPGIQDIVMKSLS